MGAAIAGWCAIKGKTATLSDPDWDQIGRALPAARKLCAGVNLSALETRNALDRLIPDPRGDGLPRADLMIEAGPKEAEIKAAIFAEAEPHMFPTAILASTTSSLSLTDLARGLRRPTGFAGLHFFNPVGRMPLVNVVPTDRTFAAVTDAPGFLVNRALMPYLLEAVTLIGEGVQKEAIDRAAERFGMPTGSVELADRVGLDICLDVAESQREQLERPLPDLPG